MFLSHPSTLVSLGVLRFEYKELLAADALKAWYPVAGAVLVDDSNFRKWNMPGRSKELKRWKDTTGPLALTS